MKWNGCCILVAALMGAGGARAQLAVDSDGSDGILSPTGANTLFIDLALAASGNTCDCDEDGQFDDPCRWDCPSPNAGSGIYDPEKWAVVFKYTSVNIATNRSVGYYNHPSGAPVVWLVQGNVTINGNLFVHAASSAQSFCRPGEATCPGPGGFRGGEAATTPNMPGGGRGPGGGDYISDAAFAAASFASSGGISGALAPATTYGNLGLLPLIGGSGGAAHGDISGMHGGGAILIAAGGSITVNGTIFGRGLELSESGIAGGSGGGIRLIANSILGSGTFLVYGTGSSGTVAGDGRVRLEALGSITTGFSVTGGVVSQATITNPPEIWPPSDAPSLSVISLAYDDLTGQPNTVPISADPRAKWSFPDADATFVTDTPVILNIAASYVPLDWVVTVRVVPKSGSSFSVTAEPLSGTLASASTTATFALPPGFAAVQVVAAPTAGATASAISREFSVHRKAPDLSVSNLETTPTVLDAQNFTLTWTVTNVGQRTASGRWFDQVVLSPDSILGNSNDVVLACFAKPGDVASGGHYQRTKQVCLPEALPPGSNYLFVVTDVADTVAEQVSGSLAVVNNHQSIPISADSSFPVVPACTPRPECVLADVPGFNVEVYSSGITFASGMAMSNDGAIYFGRQLAGGCCAPARILRIGVGGSPVNEFGNQTIADPDWVQVDEQGLISGVSGSVLVGAGNSIVAVRPDQSVVTIFSGGVLGNLTNMVVDHSGRLLALDDDEHGGTGAGRIHQSTGGTPSEFAYVSCDVGPWECGGGWLTIGPANEVYSWWYDGWIRIHDEAGNLIDPSFANLAPANGAQWGAPLAFSPGNEFGSYLYAFDTSTGVINRFDSDGTAHEFGTGFGGGSSLLFGPDGAMYVAEESRGRVLRITPDGTCAAPQPTVIDFENLGLAQGQSVGTIGIATFNGVVAVGGSPRLAFFSSSGDDLGATSPFNTVGNEFLTNSGGGNSPDAIKTVAVDFAEPVSQVSMLICDVDALPPTNIEQFRVEAFDAAMNSLGTVVYTAPDQSPYGDGAVAQVDLGQITGIRKLVMTLREVGTNQANTSLGFGIDNLQFVTAQPCNIANFHPQPNSDELVGVPFTLSGRIGCGGIRTAIVTVDGGPVQSIDGSGQFFHPVVIDNLGPKCFAVEASLETGLQCFETVCFNGVDAPQADIDETSDVTRSITARYSNTTYNPQSKIFITYVSAQNGPAGDVDAPIMLVIDSISDPSVRLINADGVGEDGRPYVMIVDPAATDTLHANEQSEPHALAFSNPNGVPVRFTVSWRAVQNRAPVFLSIPLIHASEGAPYSYTPAADDPDNHPVTIAVEVAPAGAIFAQGVLSWTPTAADVGSHSLAFVASDSRGGRSRQNFSIEVLPHSANRPPTFSSAPGTHVAAAADYSYEVVAADPDGDPVTLSLLSNPPGMQFDFSEPTRLSWDYALPDPTECPGGDCIVSIRASDGRGGISEQNFVLTVGNTPSNPNAPSLFGSPGVEARIDALFMYQPASADPDPGDVLDFDLPVAPSGMQIEPGSGRVTWIPAAGQAGLHPVRLRVRDRAGIGGPYRGGSTTQEWTITVSTGFDNRPPVILSVPSLTAKVNTTYYYQVEAADPEGFPVTLQLVNPPGGVTMTPAGLVSWTPTVQGIYPIAVKGTDPQGKAGNQVYLLTVFPPNANPAIQSTPPIGNVVAGTTFRYDVNAADPDGDTLTYILLPSRPEGMSIHPVTGLITWVPEASQIGSTGTFQVSVIDSFGGSATQSLNVTVVADTVPPTAAIVFSVEPANVDEAMVVCAYGGDNVGIASRTLTANDVPLTLDAWGCGSYTRATLGFVSFEAVITDPVGNSDLAERDLLVVDPTANQPTITLIAPSLPATVTAASPIEVTITDPLVTQFSTVRVTLRPSDSQQEEVLADLSNLPVMPQPTEIAVIDPTKRPNGEYIVSITAVGANAGGIQFPISIAGDFKLGNFSMSFTDLTLPVAGIPMVITRTYDSLDTRSGDFGAGWRLGLPGRVTDSPADSASSLGDAAFVSGTRVFVTRPDGRRVGFTFAPTGAGGLFGSFFGYLFRPQFQADAGVTDKIEAIDAPHYVWYSGGQFLDYYLPFNPRSYRLTTREGVQYEIDEFDGLRKVIDRNGNSLLVTRDGLQYVPSGETSPTLAITFVRDAEGRITDILEPPQEQPELLQLARARDIAAEKMQAASKKFHRRGIRRGQPDRDVSAKPDRPSGRDNSRVSQGQGANPCVGRLQYEYDPIGNLVSFTDQECNTTAYSYGDPQHPRFLTKIEDPLNRPAIRNEFDTGGRLVATIDAEGNRIEYARDIDARQEIIEDRLGHHTVLYYDDRGNVILRIDAFGEETAFEYDEHNRLARETDCAGRVKEYTYDASGNLLSETNCSDGITIYTRNANGQPLTRTDAVGNVTRYVYDEDGNLIEETAPDGGVVTHAYNDLGLRISTTNVALGATETFEYDALGRMTAHVNFSGARTEYTYNVAGDRISETKYRTLSGGGQEAITTQFVYDDAHRETQVIDPYGHSVAKQYDAAGQLEFTFDQFNIATQNVYDVLGNLIEIRYPDSTVESYTYDLEGRRASLTNRSGYTTRYEYDFVGRLVKTIHPDGTPADPMDNPYVEIEYDCVGRILTQWDERRNATQYDHTCSPNEQVVIDALNNATVHEFDLVGNRIRMTDALGHTTRYLYDGMGRLIRTTYHDGSTTRAVFDQAGRKTADIDQDGKVTNYEHDAGGRLTAVVLHNGGQDLRTSYTYDENGNQLTQTDAELRTTSFAYDKMSRRISRKLPLNQEETTVYDIAGRMLSKTDFNDDTIVYEYDAVGRLTRETTPDGGYFEYAYNGTGKRTLERIVCPGEPTLDTIKTYDERDRIILDSNPDGSSIEYEYDAAGNRTLLIAATLYISQTTGYEFDVLNRLSNVIHPDGGGISTYTYDAVGNRASLTLPNNTMATYQYDVLNRLTVLTNARGDASIISRYAYTVSPSGQRTRVDETTPSGNLRVVQYTYDDVYRLTREQIIDPENADLDISYFYDKVGNRMSKTLIGPGGTSTILYSYDTNDRLLTEVETVKMAGAVDRKRQSYVASGIPVPTIGNYYASRTLLAVTGLTLLWPVLLLLPRRRGIGRRARRRRIAAQTIALFLLPVQLLSPGDAQRLHYSAQVYATEGDVTAAGTSATTTTYSYDDNGNTLSRSRNSLTDSYSWDFRRRLVAAQNRVENTSDTTFFYDANGIRVKKTITSESTTDFLVDRTVPHAEVIVETIASPAIQTVAYVLGDERLTGQWSGVTRTYHFDGQMSARQLTDSLAVISDTYAFDAFGMELTHSGNSPNLYRYTGERYDANLGYYYLRARYYAQQLGRLLSLDYQEGLSKDPTSLHKYQYARANPIAYGDPSGEVAWLIGFASLARTLLIPTICFLVGIVFGTIITSEVKKDIERAHAAVQADPRDGIAWASMFMQLLVLIFLLIVSAGFSLTWGSIALCAAPGFIAAAVGLIPLLIDLYDAMLIGDGLGKTVKDSIREQRRRLAGQQ